MCVSIEIQQKQTPVDRPTDRPPVRRPSRGRSVGRFFCLFWFYLSINKHFLIKNIHILKHTDFKTHIFENTHILLYKPT